MDDNTPEQTDQFLDPAALMEAGRRVADTTPEETPTETPPDPPGPSELYRRAFAATERYSASSAKSPQERVRLETEAEQLRFELSQVEGWETKERLWDAVIERAKRYALGETLEPLEPEPEPEETIAATEKED